MIRSYRSNSWLSNNLLTITLRACSKNRPRYQIQTALLELSPHCHIEFWVVFYTKHSCLFVHKWCVKNIFLPGLVKVTSARQEMYIGQLLICIQPLAVRTREMFSPWCVILFNSFQICCFVLSGFNLLLSPEFLH